MDCEKLDLGTKCTIIKAEELHAQMENLIQGGHDVEIDASKVEKLDTSALQLLLSFHQVLTQDGRNLSWLNPSEHTVSTAKLLGLDTHLGISRH
jgi:anti-anti-sigma regulatory factor